MLNQKKYSCGICKTTPDQISHHKSHIETQKHKDKKELFELKLYKLSDEELMNKYKTTNIDDISNETETILYSSIDNIKIDNNLCEYKDIQDIMETQNCISNKEALKDKIHEIHNFLRNNGAGYGMNALKVFNILYGLKKIEENGLIDSVGLKRPECEFSYLLSVANENNDNKLTDLIYRQVLDGINESKIKDILFYEIPKNIKAIVFTHLIKEIDNITKIEKSSNVLLSGKVYEYFIGRDESAISELGAYFTDRHIVDYIYQRLEPSINEDGTVSTMIDMFGGSGGFTTGYINYLNEKYPKGINWETELSKISHFDMNEDVIKSAGLEFFCLTGVLPDMKNNLGYKNSFTDDFLYKKYKFPITNPPYGGDKNSKSVIQEKGEKIKEYIKNELKTITDEGIRIARQKQLKSIEAREKQDKQESNKTKVCVDSCSYRIKNFARIHKITGNDKEACSLMLLMDMLDVGGTAIGVLKEGVFFNKTYKDIRKCLIENFNVREVISVPSDQFENTSTKTSIVIFDNTEDKTREVKFYDLVVERYEADKFVENNGIIMIAENMGDISGISDTHVSVATREEILANAICSLNGKDYNKKVIVCGEGYELVRLGDICKCLTTTKHCTNIGKQEGKYKFYNSSQDSKLYVDFCEVKDYSIILGQGGNFNIHIDKNFTASKHVCVIQPNNVNDILLNYLYYIIPELQKSFITNGSTISWLNKTNIRDFKIPIPKSEQKIIEWVDKISKPYDEKNSKQNKIKELEEYVKNKIKDIGENEECDEVELGSICELKDGYDFYRDEMDNRKTYIEGENLPLLKIGCDAISDYIKINKKYDKYIVNKGDIVIGTKGTCGKIRKININKAYHKHGLLKIIEFKINKNYLYYLLLLLLDDETIEKMTNKSVLSNMKKEKLIKMKLLIPKNKQLINDLEPTFDEIEKLQEEVKQAETLYNQLIKELSDEAIPHNPNTLLTEANVEAIKNTTITPDGSSVDTSTKSSCTIASLREQCKSLGLKGYSKMNKADLIKLLQETDNP
jgi:type I restriction-modification system DNA methylase subunit